MAIFPCDMGQHRYAGPQQSIYLTVIEGRDANSRALRLCRAHFDEAVTRLSGSMQDVTENGEMHKECDHCGKPRETTVFARIYANRAEEVCLAADVCADHRAEFMQSSLFREGRALTAR